MRPTAKIFTLFAETSLHPGTGQTTGIVDLPIQRERHTGFPKIESTGIKGCLRDVAEQNIAEELIINTIFGPPTTDSGSGHAGALAVTDARILAFPVRSLTDVFVWVTCPMVLQRLERDFNLGGLSFTLPDGLAPKLGEAWFSANDSSPFIKGETLVLEEYSFSIQHKDGLKSLTSELEKLLPESSGSKRVSTHLALIHDDEFSHFVMNATQVSARILLTGGKTTGEWKNPEKNNEIEKGNLWYEETLPPDTILYCLALAHAPRGGASDLKDASAVLKAVENLFSERPYLQVGGNETVGQGWCAVKWNNGG